MSDAYLRNRQFYEDISGSTVLTTASTATALAQVTARSQDHAIFMQKVHIRVTTGNSGKTWTLLDTAGTPRPVTGAVPCDAVGSFEIDFGADGYQLTAGKNLALTISAAGAAGVVSWEGYTKPVTSFSLFVSK